MSGIFPVSRLEKIHSVLHDVTDVSVELATPDPPENRALLSPTGQWHMNQNVQTATPVIPLERSSPQQQENGVGESEHDGDERENVRARGWWHFKFCSNLLSRTIWNQYSLFFHLVIYSCVLVQEREVFWKGSYRYSELRSKTSSSNKSPAVMLWVDNIWALKRNTNAGFLQLQVYAVCNLWV